MLVECKINPTMTKQDPGKVVMFDLEKINYMEVCLPEEICDKFTNMFGIDDPKDYCGGLLITLTGNNTNFLVSDEDEMKKLYETFRIMKGL